LAPATIEAIEEKLSLEWSENPGVNLSSFLILSITLIFASLNLVG